MRRFCLLICFCLQTSFGYADVDSYLLSSERLLEKKNASLKEFDYFVFFFLLKMEKEDIQTTIQLINQELRQVGQVVQKEIFTEKGVDLECFSNPTLQFTIQRLVDKKGEPLPVLKAELSINTVVEIVRNKEYLSLESNRWTVYLRNDENEKNDLQKTLKETLPFLLKQFYADFQRVNGKEKKPTYYITYDSSSWARS